MKRIYFTGIFYVISMLFNSVNAQPNKPLPAMFVDKSTTNLRINRFSGIPDSKYEKLRKLNGYQDFFFIYTRKAIDDLLLKINKKNGIRVYFARYNKACDNNPLPADIEDIKIILLFAAEPDPGSKPTKFYFLNDKFADDKIYEVTQECGEAWIKDYQDNVQDELRKTLKEFEKHPDNVDRNIPGEYSDTKWISYPQDNINKAFTAEEAVTHKINNKEYKITAYKVSFSAYDATGNGGNGPHFYRNRLLIQFDYMYTEGNNKEVFYLDDMDGFSERPQTHTVKRIKQEKNKKSPGSKKGIDNGLLCPTNCP